MRFDFTSLTVPLPEDIQRVKLAGDFDSARALIAARLNKPNLPYLLKERLLLEGELLGRWEKRYPYTREQALEIMQKRVKDFEPKELDEAELDGCVDYIYVNGEKRYISSFGGTLLRMRPALFKRSGEQDEKSRLDEFITQIKAAGSCSYSIKIRAGLKLSDSAFTPGVYTAHLPVPAAASQQRAADIHIQAEPGGIIADANALQRTVCYKRQLNENTPFSVEYSYKVRLKYVDPFNDAPHIVYPDSLLPTADDLAEQLPHIRFTPYLKSLAKEIAGSETRPLYLARRVYDFITQNVRYSFMRSYILIDSHAEYAASNLKGDCGIQAILFITLLRILGIPARWQSGLTVNEKETGCHDWAQFWTEEFGWLFADPSFGGGAFRAGNEERRLYYFGNLDAFRMVANRRYQSPFVPSKEFERFDPYDNQDGEIENENKGFDCYEFDSFGTTLSLEQD